MYDAKVGNDVPKVLNINQLNDKATKNKYLYDGYPRKKFERPIT
jgi:hypothetical protein